MIKLLLSCALCTSTLLISLEMYRGKVRLADTASELSETVGRMLTLLRFEGADVYTICREAFTEEYPAFRAISNDFPVRWESVCNTLTADTETKRLMMLAGETLGASDTESQIERLTLIRDDLRAHAKELHKKAAESKRLYTTLGAAAGLAAVIFMI